MYKKLLLILITTLALNTFASADVDKNFILKKNNNQKDEQDIKKYEDRLFHEINIINSMDYASYFLIVSDYIKWAKKNSIPVQISMGGGYSVVLKNIIEAHSNTFRLAQEIFF